METTSSAVELPRYQCHKQVRAAKITGIAPSTSDRTLLKLEEIGGIVTVPLEWATKHKPQIGGYYVQYSDDYTSYSPAKAFEEGYTRIPADYKDRVRLEHADLVTKITKLEAYLISKHGLTDIPYVQLCDQLEAMRLYRDILAERIANF